MSDNAAAEQRAFTELDSLVRNLAAELANFRRRALLAEARLKEIEEHEGGTPNVDLAARISALEHDKERLQSRLDAATAKAKQMLDRVKFLRQQARGGDK
jgi:predicted  nucleic acid-binding Zn-ribbon protein